MKRAKELYKLRRNNMIKLKDADHDFQRCNSCLEKNVTSVTMKPDRSNHSQSFHLCNSCLINLISLIKEKLDL